jgi:hypothetical protein
VFTRAPEVDIALDLASNEIASFTFGASLSNATTTTTEEKADNDIKFRVVNARSVRAASIDTNTGEFLFDATKVTNTNAQQQKKMIDVTVEAIDPRGESAQISFPILVSNVPNTAGNTEIQRKADGGWTIRTLEKRARRRRVAAKKVKEMAKTWKKQPPPTRTTRAKKRTRRLKNLSASSSSSL